jgi:sterol desaturase/sphingolipid hydroxylase (fatty acid hydroxylase superfamily)
MLYLVVGIINLVLMSFLGYWSHRFFHSPKSGMLYLAHKNHHFLQYPKSNLLSSPTEGYRSAGKDNTTYLFAAVFAPIVICAILLMVFKIIPVGIGVLILSEMAIVSIINEFLHSAFHLSKSIWHYFPGFKKLQKLHFIHHHRVLSNLGIYSYAWDRIFGTYRDKLK